MKKLRLSLIFNEREEEEEKVGEEEEEEDTMAGTHTRRLRNIKDPDPSRICRFSCSTAMIGNESRIFICILREERTTILRERGIIRGRLGFTFFVYVKSMKNIYIYV